MSAAQAPPQRARLAVVPVPAARPAWPPAGLGWVRWRLTCAADDAGYWLQFRVLGCVVRRLAPVRMREAAWRAGFELPFGRRPGPFWLVMLDEYDTGEGAGNAAAPLAPPAPSAPAPSRMCRLAGCLPMSRGRAQRQLTAVIDVALMAAGVTSAAPAAGRPRLVVVHDGGLVSPGLDENGVKWL